MTNILTIDELKNSVLNANIDDEYIQPAIDEAQSIYLREILGDALLNAIINKINSNNLTGKYLTLVNDYVKPYLSYMIQSIIVVPITYKIRNAGVIQQYDNGFTTTQMKDTQYLKDYYDGKAEFYGNRLTEWLRKNASDIVEYRLSASNVTNPTTSQNVTNIFLGGTKRGKCVGISTSGGGGTHDTVDWDDITNRPDFATVATSGSYDDLSNKPEIPSLDGYATEQWVENQGYSTFSGDYEDLTNKPEIGNGILYVTQNNIVKGVFKANQTGNTTVNLSSGVTDYNDLTNKPDLSHYVEDTDLATVATSGSYNDLSDKPDMTHYVEDTDLANVATSGDYNDLLNKPEIPTVNNATLTITQGGATKGTFTANAGTDVTINLEAGGSGSTDWNDIANKPDFATVATSGSYDDLSDKPVIPAAQVNADWDANSGVAQILNKPSLATVATSGSYNDLSDKPTIPSAQVNADWNASSGVQEILNKPDLDDYVRVIDYEVDKQTISNALADKVETDNLCRINNERLDTNANFELVRMDSIATLTITQGGATKGTFTPDSGTDVTINLDAGGSGSTDWNDITNKPNFATVATSGDYRDLNNKPNLAQVATSGDYRDLSNTPTIPTLVQANWTESDSSDPSFVRNKPSLGAVATSNDYRDLDNKPSLAQVATSGDYRDLSNTPNFAAVATSGDYHDLTHTPTIVTPVNANWTETDPDELSYILNKPSLAQVATSGDYRDLSNTPSLGTVATSNDYQDLDNKPTIPTVNDGLLTIQQNGTTIATFTANDDATKTANITVPTDETDLGLTTETWTFTLQDSTTVTKTVVIK